MTKLEAELKKGLRKRNFLDDHLNYMFADTSALSQILKLLPQDSVALVDYRTDLEHHKDSFYYPDSFVKAVYIEWVHNDEAVRLHLQSMYMGHVYVQGMFKWVLMESGAYLYLLSALKGGNYL